MREIDAVKARAIAYKHFGTPGRHAPQDRAVLMDAVDAVLGLHREMPCLDEDGDPIGGFYCEECKDLDDHSGERVHEVYPCMTVREITKAFTGQESYAAMRDKIEGVVK